MNKSIIESDVFPFEHISVIAEKESWRKEINRPLYHLHKWWAKRLGSVFRAIALGCALREDVDFMKEFYASHNFFDKSILDPFMGSGTTIGEAVKLGFTALGCDINPVAAETVRVALTPINYKNLELEFNKIKLGVGQEILDYYKTRDSRGEAADVLYYFWVMQSQCMSCSSAVDLFSSYIIAQNAYPQRKPEIQVVCPSCNSIFQDLFTNDCVTCPECSLNFNPRDGIAKKTTFICHSCKEENSILKSIKNKRPNYRLYAKLILTENKRKEYLKVDQMDLHKYSNCSRELKELLATESISLPNLNLQSGHNTQQAINYGFNNWSHFFNDRQLLLLSKLYQQIFKIEDEKTRDILALLFSATLEFNNMFVSYKGEGTGAVRHMFSHHILKPERTPIEANLWGTNKSSGSFSGIFKAKISRMIKYWHNPKEVKISGNHHAPTLNEKPIKDLGNSKIELDGGIYLSCGDSTNLVLKDQSVDFVITDPPFFDNVHYSELSDFFYSWLKIYPHGFIDGCKGTTRNAGEVQDADASKFSSKLRAVFLECNRVMKQDGIMIFSYHHSKTAGWSSIAASIFESGFYVENYHPVKAEMSVATPKQQAKDPIQIDILLVCKKKNGKQVRELSSNEIIEAANIKIRRLEMSNFHLSANDKKIILYGQLLTSSREVPTDNFLTYLLKEYLNTELQKELAPPI
ncbi:MAG: DNA methyltransferase [Chitinophagaceae bacterium]